LQMLLEAEFACEVAGAVFCGIGGEIYIGATPMGELSCEL